MITGFFLNIIFAFVVFLIGLLPLGGTFPTSWTSGIHTIWGAINQFSFIVPVNVLVSALVIAMTFHLFIFGWKALHWLYSLIRGAKIH